MHGGTDSKVLRSSIGRTLDRTGLHRSGHLVVFEQDMFGRRAVVVRQNVLEQKLFVDPAMKGVALVLARWIGDGSSTGQCRKVLW